MIDMLMLQVPDWLSHHASALLVVVPLLLAPICALFPSGRFAWLLAVFISLFSFVAALVLWQQTQGGLVAVSYAMGGWPPPLGIEFRIDSLNAMILLLVTGIGALAAVFSWPTVEAEIRSEKIPLFYAAYLLCLAGLSGVASTGDAFNLFVFLEVSSLSAYVLVALGSGRDRRALPAAFNYLIMGSLGASFYVIGVGFLYASTGTLNMADMAERISSMTGNRAVEAGFAFIVVGLGLKAAMWPLHQWLPNAYAYSPSFVTAFLASTATKVALYALIRFLFSVFSPDYAFVGASFGYILAPLAITAMITCSFQAIFQSDVRRTLAYSSVAQLGYMILGVSIGTAAGLSAGLFHLFNHALMKGALFMALAGVVITHQGTKLDDFRGLGRVAPWTMTGFAIAGLSLIGVPLTAGFQSKISLISAALANGWWWAAMIIVFSSVLAVIYMGRILEAVFFQAPSNPRKVRKEAPLLILVPLWILALANVWIGINAAFPVGLAHDAAISVLGAGALP